MLVDELVSAARTANKKGLVWRRQQNFLSAQRCTYEEKYGLLFHLKANETRDFLVIVCFIIMNLKYLDEEVFDN